MHAIECCFSIKYIGTLHITYSTPLHIPLPVQYNTIPVQNSTYKLETRFYQDMSTKHKNLKGTKMTAVIRGIDTAHL